MIAISYLQKNKQTFSTAKLVLIERNDIKHFTSIQLRWKQLQKKVTKITITLYWKPEIILKPYNMIKCCSIVFLLINDQQETN